MQNGEEREHQHAHPPDHEEYPDELTREQFAVRVEQTRGARLGMRGIEILGYREQPHGDGSPNPSNHVYGNRVHGVVYPDPNHQSRASEVEKTRNETDDDGGPRLDVRAAPRDGNQPAQTAHQRVGEAEHRLPRLPLHEPRLGQQGRDGPRRGGEGGVHGGVLGEVRLVLGGYVVHGPGVESVPSEPQDEYPQDLQRDGMTREIVGAPLPVPVVVKPSLPRPEDERGDERRQSSRGVHHQAPREVDHPHSQQRIGPERAEESRVVPDRVRHHGIHERREGRGVGEVGEHLTPFRQRARDDRRGRGREGELEQPEGLLVDVHEEEVLRADESRARVVGRASPREGVAHGVEPQGGAARVEQVLEHGVLEVLHPNGSRAQHGESRLHVEDE
mmetsp:Transcript_2208/g.4803  ORF Transcript_2208/g.4803 Transcript_2208/m.4803 type:complete len:389 (-) Transcript_2208:382-1548(-)